MDTNPDRGTGAGMVDAGYVFNVTVTNHNAVTAPEVEVAAAVDFLPLLTGAGHSLLAAGGKPVLCGPAGAIVAVAAKSGHLGTDGFRPGWRRNASTGTGGEEWMGSWALAGNYPGGA